MRNYWNGTASVGRELGSLSTEALRGGPALLMPPRTTWSVNVHSDTRKSAQGVLATNGFRDDGTGGRGTTVVVELDARLTDRLRVAVAPGVSRANEALRYVGHVAGATPDAGYIVGRLTQTTASLTARADLAFSPHATLQLYAQPLIGSARYSELGEVVAPRAPRIDDRVRPVSPPGLEIPHSARATCSRMQCFAGSIDRAPHCSWCSPSSGMRDSTIRHGTSRRPRASSGARPRAVC